MVHASGGGSGDLEPADWRQVVDEVRTRYLRLESRASSGSCSHPKERHQDVLARSPFSQVDTTHWNHTLTRTTDKFIGSTFNLSYSRPAQLGAVMEYVAGVGIGRGHHQPTACGPCTRELPQLGMARSNLPLGRQ